MRWWVFARSLLPFTALFLYLSNKVTYDTSLRNIKQHRSKENPASIRISHGGAWTSNAEYYSGNITTVTRVAESFPQVPVERISKSPIKSCIFEETSLTGSTRFLTREQSRRGIKHRSIEASVEELGSIDVLISRCYGSISSPLFNFNKFQCIPGLKFWVYEKCMVEMYKPPEHMLPCFYVIPYNFYSGLSGTLLSHIINNFDNLANFTVSLKDAAKKLYRNNALLNLELHLSTVKRCTGFINLSEQPVLAKNYRSGRSFRPVSFNYGKHIPEKSALHPLTFLKKTKDRATERYCERFTRYTCKKCSGSIIATRQQLLLSRMRILRYPRSEYLSLRNWTFTKKQESSHIAGFDLLRDEYGFEYSYSLIFTCYQAVDNSLMRKIRASRFPIVHCYDYTC